MTYKNYYRAIIILPLLIVLHIFGLNWELILREDESGPHFGLPFYFVIMPYCLFIIFFVWGTWKKERKEFMWVVFRLPLILLPLPFALATSAIACYDREEVLIRNFTFPDVTILAIGFLAISYLYVLLAVALCRMLKIVKLIE